MSNIDIFLEPEWKDFFGKLLSYICEHYNEKNLCDLFKKLVGYSQNKNTNNNDKKQLVKDKLCVLGIIDPLTFISYLAGSKNDIKTRLTKLLNIIEPQNKQIEELKNIVDVVSENKDTIPLLTIFRNVHNYLGKTPKKSINSFWKFAKALSKEENIPIKKHKLLTNFEGFNDIILTKGNKVSNLSPIMYLCKPNRYFPIDNTNRDYLKNLINNNASKNLINAIKNHCKDKCLYDDFCLIQNFCSTNFDSPFDFYLKAIKMEQIEIKINKIFEKTDFLKDDEQEDSQLFREVANIKEFKHYNVNIIKPQKVLTGNKYVYKRNNKVAVNALCNANFLCEIDNNHETFIRKNSNINFTEVHHLIPMAFQNLFEENLDVEENIVSLCSNCHRWIHYGKDSKALIKTLYEKRKEHLSKIGIEISLNALLKMYGQ